MERQRQIAAASQAAPSGGTAPVASGGAIGGRGLGSVVAPPPGTGANGAAASDALKFLGTPYRWGGSSPSTGFDCSGLVQYVYSKVGIHIPRVTDQQILASNGTPVDRKHLLPGDLVFF